MNGGDGVGQKNLELALARKTETGLDGGIATGGGNTTLDDANKDWTVNQFNIGFYVHVIKITTGVEYFRAITANTATQLTFAALPGGVVVAAGDLYSIRQVSDPKVNWLQGLSYYGIVTAIPGANQFTIPTLGGLGAGKFADIIAPFSAFVFRDAGGAGAAPQGEMQTITAYVSATGSFTTTAFTAAVAVGDEILILHPSLAQATKSVGPPPTSGPVIANWQAAEQNLVSIGANNVRYKLWSLMIDMNAIVGALTIRLYSQINGVERRIYQQIFTVAADGPGRWLVNGVGIHEALRVTCQSDNAGDNGATIAYDYFLEAM